ncbi:toxin-antitoxin system YwqK family antitoxin [uncultured Tenacibaculum sp.]|uniref:toxin-antitoxin system YwqK family antitoxin n=1 Tax=uncultured Tenacibaculum sp. TaxID=174713 RepID=UPI00260E6B53|nr:toxin-antitoxin system YwqK family antitoxin [uncultured Tenacibaculum sp.]
MNSAKYLILFLFSSFLFTTLNAQIYTSWNEVQTKRFGKETIYISKEDNKPLNGAYKIAETSGAYADITFKNGKIDGTYISYDFAGNKSSEANYINGKIDGKQISYFQNGKIQEETYYKNGQKNGTWLTYNRQGKVYRTEQYKNDKKEGKWVKELKNVQDNTKSVIIEFYKNNEPTGRWEERLTDGKLKWEKVHSSPTNYIKKSYHLNGKIAQELQIKNRRKNGITTHYTPEGILRYKINYDNDYITYEEKYFENGTLESKTNFKYGKRNGVYTKFNEDGVKIQEGQYVDTFKSGIWKTFEGKKGRQISALTYKNGKLNGIGKFYNLKSKTVEMQGNYVSGKKHGMWKHYDASGELTKEIEFNKGKQISEKTYN